MHRSAVKVSFGLLVVAWVSYVQADCQHVT
jgi:hypothetical protein